MGKLLEVQKAALKAGRGKLGFAYYCQMGLGKTLTALTEFMELVEAKEVTRLVVISPNSFKGGWLDEIRKHGLNLHPHIFESGNIYNGFFLSITFEKPPVLIINYEAIRSAETQTYIARFVAGRKAMIVLDESIQIKTYDSQQTKAALGLAGKFKYRRILSGKPVTGGPHDLWSQMKFLGANVGNYFPFKTTYCRMGGFKGKKIVGAQNEELLAAKIDQYIFRASKADWTDLPPKLYTSREYQLTPELARMYKSMEDDFVLWLDETDNVSVDAFITKYIKLAQIQAGFIIKENGDVQELIPPEKNPRFNLVKEILGEVEGKTIVPYINKHVLSLLQRALAEYNPAYIKGNMDPAEVKAQSDKFNNDNTCRIMLAQTRASKYGFTWLGGPEPQNRCSTMVFAQNSYSLDDRSQIEDRFHRHGQTADSCLYIDVWGTPLDRNVTAALQAKESISEAVFSYFKTHSR
jgi:SNF2 family DNA or RNA helicase